MTTLDSASSPSRRQILSGFNNNPFINRTRPATPRHAQCTHLMTTRLYTKDFRCSQCMRPSSTGWLYRCIQDRELILEDDREKGWEERWDALPDAFPRPSEPRKRGPAARASKLAFLQEISDEDLKSYSSTQLAQILQQRSHVLDVALASSEAALTSDDESFYTNLSSSPTRYTSFSDSPSRPSSKSYRKPWLPIKGGECQFKCCHFCRPSLVERSFLSLNGIANDELLATAILGFGFHMAKKRPVALVKHVKNLGLRPSPPPRSVSSISQASRARSFLLAPPPGLGLAILDSTSNSNNPLLAPTPGRSLPLFPIITNPQFPPRSSSLQPINQGPSPPRTHSRTPSQLPPLPPPSPTEIAYMSAPLTPMEKEEMELGFGSQPLVVRDGVAVTEEAVGERRADLITQF